MKKIMISIALFFTHISYATAHTQMFSFTGVLAGIQHPLTGIDHLAALIAVGILAARQTGKIKQLLMPMVFLSTVFVGFAIAQTEQFTLLAENIIVISLWVLGVLLFLGNAYRNALLPVLVAVFGLAHGHAHGIEVIGTPFSFASGMLLTYCTLMALVIIVCNYDKFHNRKYNNKIA